MAAALAFQENSLYNKKQYARFGPGGTAFAARIVKGLNFLANQKKMVNDITSMDVDFSKWYTDIVKKAELMDYSSVKGCMIIEPIALRRRVTRTFTCRCSSRNPSCRRKKTT